MKAAQATRPTTASVHAKCGKIRDVDGTRETRGEKGVAGEPNERVSPPSRVLSASPHIMRNDTDPIMPLTGRAYKKLLYNRRFVNVVVGKRGGPNSNADSTHTN